MEKNFCSISQTVLDVAKQLNQQSVPVVVLFVSGDCFHNNMCGLMREIAREYEKEIVSLCVRSNGDHFLLEQLHVDRAPLIIVCKKGKEIARFSCPDCRDALLSFLQTILSPDENLHYLRKNIPVV